MVFSADAAFALILIALGTGYWILVKARQQETGNLKGFGTFLGYFILIVAFLTLLCSGYYSLRYWEDGYFNRPAMHSGYRMNSMHPGMGMQGGHGMYFQQGGHQKQCGPGTGMTMHKSMCKGHRQGMMDQDMMSGDMPHHAPDSDAKNPGMDSDQ